MKRKRHIFLRKALLRAAPPAAALMVAFAAGYFFPHDAKPTRTMTVTAYCNCERCCGWHLDEAGVPVFSGGPLKGKPKEIGITASGKRTTAGTVASSPTGLPLGTLLYIEGEGVFRVEDRGGGLQNDQLDMWFPTHEEALQWGRQKRRVTVLGNQKNQ
ncbi:MAG: 3D domain-containing protein [Puniceicoccales bacterium]|jgi:3D (Asp-Asp-Asp) domain-containing protein|nr:3D domain-containing protein [Puniceicoccales bacterium]